MTNGDDNPGVYQALALPEQALDQGGTEILRLGIINEELYVSALPAFKDPSQWGVVLAEVARRLGAIYAAQMAGVTNKDMTVQIVEAFASEMGAVPVKAAKAKPAKSKPAKAKSGKAKPRPVAKKTARKKR
jgi:hypothetical protein